MTAARVHAICWLALVGELIGGGEDLRYPSDLLAPPDFALWSPAAWADGTKALPWAEGWEAEQARAAWRRHCDAIGVARFYHWKKSTRGRLSAVRRAIAALEAQP